MGAAGGEGGQGRPREANEPARARGKRTGSIAPGARARQRGADAAAVCYNRSVDLEELRERTERAEKLAAAGDDRAAARVLAELAASDLPALDRALAWTHAASAHERLGEIDAALADYDRAVALESPLLRFTAAFKKADFLLRAGRKDESRALFQSLLSRPETTLAERSSFESRLKLLRRVPGKK